MKRRDFLTQSSTAIALGSVIPGFSFSAVNQSSMLGQLLASGSSDNDRVLVLVQLDGGNDGLNTLIPIDQYSDLSHLRDSVMIPEDKVLKLEGKDNVGLHSSMEGIQDLYKEGKVNFVQGVGYPEQNFSHFRSTDIWLSGSDSDKVETTGWLGRYLDLEFPNFPFDYPSVDMEDPLAIQIGSLVSPTFMGPTMPMAMSIFNDSDFYELVNGVHSTPADNAIGKELKYIREITKQAIAYNDAIKEAAGKITSQYPYPSDNKLADQLKIVAKLIAGGLKTKIYMVSIGGFDTHANQVDIGNKTVGSHADLLSKVSEAIYSFQNDIEHLKVQDRVVGMTFSEFGRRIVSNGSFGTDHGSSLPMMLFGTSVENGIIGINPEINKDFTVRDNLAMQYDFRSVYASILEQWFCLDSEALNKVLLNNFQALPLISKSICATTSIIEHNTEQEEKRLNCYPNPFDKNVNITVKSKGGHCLLQIFDTEGRVVSTIVDNSLPMGEHQYQWSKDVLASGFYYCRFQNESYQQTFTLQKVR